MAMLGFRWCNVSRMAGTTDSGSTPVRKTNVIGLRGL
jgi:hypothetical protein